MLGSPHRLTRLFFRNEVRCISSTSTSALAIAGNKTASTRTLEDAKKKLQTASYGQYIRSYGVAASTKQHDELTLIQQRDNEHTSFCATIQAEIPNVVEDILKFYDEIGRPMVRTRYLDNLQFEERLIQSKLRSDEESSRPRRDEDIYDNKSATATNLEDQFQVVAVEAIDEMETSSETLKVVPMDHKTQNQINDEPLSLIEPSEIEEEEIPADRPLKLVDRTASLVSSYKTLSNEVSSSIILLRTISDQEWIEFDHPKGEELDHLSDGDLESVLEDDISIEESDQIKEDFERGQRLSAVSEIIKENHSKFDIDDYNTILARLAISTELLPDEIIARLMDLCGQMRVHCMLDSTALEIILLALGRRFSASPTAAKFVLEVTSDVEWSSKMMEAAADICEQRNSHDLAKKLLDTMSSSSVRVPKRAYRSLLNYAKIDDKRDYALQVLEHAVDNAESINDHALDRVLANSVRWRSHNKYGKKIDNRSLYLEILQLLDLTSSTYRPGYVVWEALIDAISIGAKESPDRWKMVAQAFNSLRRERPGYYPSHRLLMHGLDASHALELPELACELICRAMDNYHPRSDNGDDESGSPVRMVSVMDVSRAMQVCAEAGENGLCRRILEAAGKMGFQNVSMSNLYHMALNAAAKGGHVNEAEQILISMQKSGLRPGSMSYCSLMHAYAMSSDLSQATHLLEALESDEDEQRLIPTALYDGYILACVRCDAWERIFAVFDKMKEIYPKMAPSSITTHGLILACHRTGRLDGKDVVQDLLDMDATFNEEAALVGARILLPGLCSVGPLSTASLCENLKALSSGDAKFAAELHRILVVASVDTNRDIQTMPRVWNHVVAAMHKFRDASENRGINSVA